VPDLCLGCAWIVPGLCLGCAWAVPGLCLGCAWAVPGLCLGCAWAVPGLCLGCAWAVPGLCLGCAWAVPGLCLGCAWAVPGLCLGCAWAVPGLCLGCAWAVPGLCLGCAWAVPGLCLGFVVVIHIHRWYTTDVYQPCSWADSQPAGQNKEAQEQPLNTFPFSLHCPCQAGGGPVRAFHVAMKKSELAAETGLALRDLRVVDPTFQNQVQYCALPYLPIPFPIPLFLSLRQ